MFCLICATCLLKVGAALNLQKKIILFSTTFCINHSINVNNNKSDKSVSGINVLKADFNSEM